MDIDAIMICLASAGIILTLCWEIKVAPDTEYKAEKWAWNILIGFTFLAAIFSSVIAVEALRDTFAEPPAYDAVKDWLTWR